MNSGKSISDKDKHKIKETAKKLLERLKINEFKVDHWVYKIQKSSAVKKAINDYLFESLPYPTFGDGDIIVKTEILFNYFKNSFADFGRVT